MDADQAFSLTVLTFADTDHDPVSCCSGPFERYRGPVATGKSRDLWHRLPQSATCREDRRCFGSDNRRAGKSAGKQTQRVGISSELLGKRRFRGSQSFIDSRGNTVWPVVRRICSILPDSPQGSVPPAVALKWCQETAQTKPMLVAAWSVVLKLCNSAE